MTMQTLVIITKTTSLTYIIEALVLILYLSGHWGEWSLCSNQCGVGFKFQKWNCYGKTDSCPNFDEHSMICSSKELCGLGKQIFLCFKIVFHFSQTFIDCSHPFVGDGYCDDFYNWDVCEFDGGDCCRLSRNTEYCELCACLQAEQYPVDTTCMHKLSYNDGICEDYANNERCGFDGGNLLYHLIMNHRSNLLLCCTLTFL